MAVQKQKSDQAMGLMRQGCVEVKQGNYAEGQAFFNKALAVDKTDPTLWLLLADVCERQGRWAEALRTYQGLLKGSGRYSSLCSDPVTHLRYALALLRNGQWQEATTEYANVRYQINQTDPTALPNRDFDPGKDNRPRLEAAVHLVLGTRRPTYGWFYGPLATEDRRKHLEQAVRLQPQWALAHLKYGQILAETGHLAEAKAAYLRALTPAQGDLKPQIEEALKSLRAREEGKSPYSGTRALITTQQP